MATTEDTAKNKPFQTAYNRFKKTSCPTGKKIEDKYGWEINKHGQKYVTKVGEENVYEKIQLYLEESKIESVLARVVNGDTSALRPEGMYVDTLEYPHNLIDARKMMMNLENTWNGLPKEIRDKYNNDVEMFIGKSGTEQWMIDMGLIKKGEEINEQKHGTTLQSHTADRSEEKQI